ncbi:flagellar basal body rod protein FlgB [Paragemmobacter straminiformis]|uniref:Flagellar basal body rod protein FlgB n=1 Tax=Paragemmobacter straminiformis TaxID=2045119 RepID=A0A842I561_9RHOB|nr:flagellar basal body rod protein FlgB [Gemmobacter straminiformis]MBC2834749.1 flagellar basal body rod protein FlgB [Gemmobacter straminiformis]
MTVSFSDSIALHANALSLREKRNEILASNIANAATPNFKARDFDFEAELARASGPGSAATGAEPALAYRVPVNTSLDGNTVELSVEQMEFSENTLRYQTSLSFLNRRISGLLSAIKGE